MKGSDLTHPEKLQQGMMAEREVGEVIELPRSLATFLTVSPPSAESARQ